MGRENRIRRIRFLLVLAPFLLGIAAIVLSVMTIFMINSQNEKISQLENETVLMQEQQILLLEKVNVTSNELTGLTDRLSEFTTNMAKLERRIPIGGDVKVERGSDEWPKKVYLTFDDGPSANTQKILDILEHYGVKGNFFVVGTKSDNLKKMYKKIVDSGNVLGMHSYSHKYSEVYSSKEAFIEDLDNISELIKEETGIESKIYRFPGGSSNNVSRVPMKELIQVLNERGITYYDWNVESGDATNPVLPVEDIIENSLATIGKYEEAMILFHDLSNKTTTVEALPTIIETLLEQGITIAPIDDNTMLIQHENIK